jgi:tetratricopeptide (TPR) repeat protein
MKLHRYYIATFALLCCLMVKSSGVLADNTPYIAMDSGTAEYNKANYSKAINFYQKFLASGLESAQALYNLGNCYYRTNEIPKAILYYEKAEKLTPADPDIHYNLQLANQKIIDKSTSDTPVFIYSDWKKFENNFTEKQWALICISILCLSLLFFALYLSFSRILVKQLFFWSGFTMVFLFLFAFFIANQQYDTLNSHDTAIVMSSSITVKGAPEENATQLFVLHEGTKVWIVKNEGEWTEIKLSNGNQGWLNSSDISEI